MVVNVVKNALGRPAAHIETVVCAGYGGIRIFEILLYLFHGLIRMSKRRLSLLYVLSTNRDQQEIVPPSSSAAVGRFSVLTILRVESPLHLHNTLVILRTRPPKTRTRRS